MNTNILFLITILAFGASSFAQDGQGIVVTESAATLDLVGSQTRVNVPAIDAGIVINHQGTEIEEIEVITGAYDAKYRPTVTRIRSESDKSILARFSVKGHPNGPYSVIFTEADGEDGTAAAEGRQKNRRVEMTIEYD